MYVIMVYDIEADRTQRMLRLGRRYLTYVQNSGLEGEISAGDLTELRGQIKDILKPHESVVLYELSSDTLVDRTVYGDDPAEESRFI